MDPATLQSLLDHLLKLLRHDDIVVLAGSLPVNAPADTYRVWGDACREKGAKVILDSDGAGMVEGVKAKPFLIKPNSEELSHLMGRAFLDAGSRADIVPLAYDWSSYKTVVLPTVLILSTADTQRLADFAAAGGRVVVGYATGLIDEHFHTWLGGYPGAGDGLLRSMLGVRGEEFNILGAEAEGEPGEIRLSSADDSAALDGTTTRLWQNDVNVTGEHAQVLATYTLVCSPHVSILFH